MESLVLSMLVLTCAETSVGFPDWQLVIWDRHSWVMSHRQIKLEVMAQEDTNPECGGARKKNQDLGSESLHRPGFRGQGEGRQEKVTSRINENPRESDSPEPSERKWSTKMW